MCFISKIIFPIFTVIILFTCSCHPNLNDDSNKKSSQVSAKPKMRCVPQFPIQVGTNLSGWLSTSAKAQQTSKGRAEFMKESDIVWIAEQGFDHVRIPVDEAYMYDEQGMKIDSSWLLLHEMLAWVQKEDMRVIFDLHNIRAHNFDTEVQTLFTQDTSRTQFLELWDKLQNELRQYPTEFLAYEILNEPWAKDPEDWNDLFAEAYQNIRATEPDRVMILGSSNFSHVSSFPELKVPALDSNLLLSFHFYEPYIFTHYKTTWSDHTNYVGQSEYPGKAYYIDQAKKQVSEKNLNKIQSQIQYADRRVLDSLILIAITRADELKLPLHCGEFGVFKRGPSPKFRYNWYRDMVDILNAHGIPYANWDYKAQDEFGLRLEAGLPDRELIKILTGKTK